MGENKYTGYAIGDFVIGGFILLLTFLAIGLSKYPFKVWPFKIQILVIVGALFGIAALVAGFSLIKKFSWAEKASKIICWSSICWYGLLILINIASLFLKEDVASFLGLPITYLKTSRIISQLVFRAGFVAFFYFHVEKLDSHQVGLEY